MVALNTLLGYGLSQDTLTVVSHVLANLLSELPAGTVSAADKLPPRISEEVQRLVWGFKRRVWHLDQGAGDDSEGELDIDLASL